MATNQHGALTTKSPSLPILVNAWPELAPFMGELACVVTRPHYWLNTTGLPSTGTHHFGKLILPLSARLSVSGPPYIDTRLAGYQCTNPFVSTFFFFFLYLLRTSVHTGCWMEVRLSLSRGSEGRKWRYDGSGVVAAALGIPFTPVSARHGSLQQDMRRWRYLLRCPQFTRSACMRKDWTDIVIPEQDRMTHRFQAPAKWMAWFLDGAWSRCPATVKLKPPWRPFEPAGLATTDRDVLTSVY